MVANTSPSLTTGLSWVRTGTCCGPGGIAGIPRSGCLRTSRRIGHNGTHITTFDSPVDDQARATMKNEVTHPEAGPLAIERSSKLGVKVLVASGVALAAAAVGIAASHVLAPSIDQAAVAAPPSVGVSVPLQREVDARLEFLGQFSAVQQVDLRAQVGGTLTKIGFKDGDIVHKGDLLFLIDPTPYRIRFSEATAQLESARARLGLANRALTRAESLKKTGAGTVENADQKVAEQRPDHTAVHDAF